MKRADQDRAHKPDQDRMSLPNPGRPDPGIPERRPKQKRRRFRSPRAVDPTTEGLSEREAAKLKRYRES